jgi:uncharacterized protein YyaL (SSP411 family)
LTGDEKYERFALAVLRLAASQIRRYPQGFGRALSAIEFYLSPVKEVVIIGERGSELERAVWERYLPNKVVVRSNEPREDSAAIPLLADRAEVEGKPTVYVCENFVCQRPVTDVDELIGMIE